MDDPTRPLIIINAAAARTRRAWPIIRDALARGRIRFDTCEPAQAGGTREQTRAGLCEGYRIIAVVGGDGTLSEAAAGFFESCEQTENDATPRRVGEVEGGSKNGGHSGVLSDITDGAALAILPAGTGDDFARGLAGAREPLENWVERLIKYCRRPGADLLEGSPNLRVVDLLHAEIGDEEPRRFICLNAATLGIGAEVAERVAAQNGVVRKLPGEARFAAAAIGALAVWRERRVRVRVDGAAIECRTNMLAVVNGTYAGGGMNFAPAARPDDGVLDVMMACGVSRLGIMRELTRIHRGGHLANPRVRVLRGTRVRIEALDTTDALGVEADGDVRGTTPVEFRVMPRALRVIF